MAGWMESWLAGAKPAESTASADAAQDYPGQRLGLPERGAGSVASMGRRFVAFVIDCVVAALITSVFVRPHLTDPASMQAQNYWSLLAWLLIALVGTSFFGITLGMALLRIRVVRMDGTAMVGPLRALPRAVLVALIVPAVIWNADYRGLHDRVAGTIVVNVR
ncbi:MAG TPA: RDD family protein [Pseudonocardiaceae bacterium]|nr:RDD family protein [Pseudonocardiaceae bacterium]